MKQLLCTILLGFFIISCNSPEQNSTTGNMEDSTTVNADTAGAGGTGSGVDNTGSNAGSSTDTTGRNTDTLSRSSGGR